MLINLSNKRYWLNWMAACAAGEFFGIGVAAGIGFLYFKVFGEPQNIGQKFLIILVAILAGIIEGTVTGSFQWSVLKKRFPGMTVRNWVGLTALGAAIAWILGMIPSTFFMPQSASSANIEPPLVLIILLAAILGLVLGALFGVFQWFELKKHTTNANRWIWANTFGWAVGMVIIFLGTSIISVDSKLGLVILIGTVSGLLAGLSVGAITGLFLVRFKYS
ncbi:MAG: hypothetical protein V1767_05405 [Chloroflexota bacterium]